MFPRLPTALVVSGPTGPQGPQGPPGPGVIGTTLPAAPGACDEFVLWSANVKTLTLQMCGAMANGTTDDTTAFQIAVTTAIDNSITLYLPG
jgi:hypothetical protein